MITHNPSVNQAIVRLSCTEICANSSFTSVPSQYLTPVCPSASPPASPSGHLPPSTAFFLPSTSSPLPPSPRAMLGCALSHGRPRRGQEAAAVRVRCTSMCPCHACLSGRPSPGPVPLCIAVLASMLESNCSNVSCTKYRVRLDESQCHSPNLCT